MVSMVMLRRRVEPKALAKPRTLLKLCVRCKHKKIKCDALANIPLPCTYCLKRNLACTLSRLHAANRATDVTERVLAEVKGLHKVLDGAISRKAALVRRLMLHRQLQPALPALPPVSAQLDTVFGTHAAADVCSSYIDPIPTVARATSFSIHLGLASEPFSISVDRAAHLLQVYHHHFAEYLPVLPALFFSKNPHEIHNESDLLFWVLIVTALLKESQPEYAALTAHVQNLVVVKCWLNTPRSILSIVALLVLTTWPLPDTTSAHLQDCISVKYLSLMKNLALQFGLHKLNFIEEFSRKTDLLLGPEPDTHNQIRERIYKYVNINSNYWLVYLGLSTSSYNGFQQDYILTKAANVDILNKHLFSPEDNFLNSLLKVSNIQLRMNEAMNDLAENPNDVAKLIQLDMFEKLLTAYGSDKSDLVQHDLITLSVQYSRLQLFIYLFSKSDLKAQQFRIIVSKAVNCCRVIMDIFEKEFSQKSFYQVPVHYRFSIELVALVLLQIHSSPNMTSVSHYENVKAQFQRAYNILGLQNTQGSTPMGSRLVMIIKKFDACNKRKLLAIKSDQNSYYMVNNMSRFLVSSLHFETVWQIYQVETRKDITDESQIDWELFGLDAAVDEHKAVIDYLQRAGSILD